MTFTAFVRALKLFAICTFYIGRIDTQLFAPGVGWFLDKIPLDGLPHCFYRDLLLHDAHRHPLIDRLGLVFMLKLKHGPNFGGTANQRWRMLFTYTMMPWLRKYLLAKDVLVEETLRRDELAAVSKAVLVDKFVALEAK